MKVLSCGHFLPTNYPVCLLNSAYQICLGLFSNVPLGETHMLMTLYVQRQKASGHPSQNTCRTACTTHSPQPAPPTGHNLHHPQPTACITHSTQPAPPTPPRPVIEDPCRSSPPRSGWSSSQEQTQHVKMKQHSDISFPGVLMKIDAP